jgi:protein arginine N-methyltransferase 1
MLQDRVRVSAQRRAIHEMVRQGDVVLDLGCGTGLLSFFACQAGARKVYAVEQNDIIDCARDLAAANGFLDRVVFIHGNSIGVELPEKVDVIVSDILPGFCPEGEVTRFLADARQRFLKPGGVLLPAQVWLFLAPIEATDVHDEYIGWWGKPLEGLNYDLVRSAAANRRYVVSLPANSLLAAAHCVEELDFYSGVAGVALDQEVRFVVERDGLLHGLAGWFDAQISPGVRLTTAPGLQQTVWQQTFFPIAEPVSVMGGDVVIGRLIAFAPDQVFWQWHLDVLSISGERKGHFRHSNFVPSRKDLVSRMPSFRPNLGGSGQVARFVLNACDGATTVQEIAHELRREFPTLCPTDEAALYRVWSTLRGQVEVTQRLSDFATN